MAWQTKLQRHRKKCQRAACGQMFQCRTVTQRWCSRRCAALAMPTGFRANRGKCGGVASARSREARALAKVRAVWPGMPDDAARAVLGLLAGQYRSGWRTGLRTGWRQALGEAA